MPAAGKDKAPTWLVFLLLGFIIVIWGSTWRVIIEGNKYTDIYTGLALRFGIAAALLFALLIIMRIKVPLDANAWMLYGLLTVCAFFVPYLLVYWAELYIESALASLLFSAFPIFVIIFAHFIIPGDRITRVKLIGALVSFAGLSLLFVGKVVSKKNPAKWTPEYYTTALGILGMLAAIGAALVQAVQTVIVKRRGKNIHPMALIFPPMLFTAIGFGIITLFHEPARPNRWTWQAWTCILVLGILGSVVTFGIYYYLVKVVDVSKLSLNAFITPLFSLFVGIVFGNEGFSLIGYLGVPLAVGGVFLATRGWGATQRDIPSADDLQKVCTGSMETA